MSLVLQFLSGSHVQMYDLFGTLQVHLSSVILLPRLIISIE